jgi:predicted AlkP superfamily pyrophosphatase or phosphodiesterase
MTRLTFLVLLLIATFTQAQQIKDSKHVVLISVDGLRPEFYLDHSWPAPNIQKLAKEGVHAYRMKSVFPSYTYPAHTAMITGALPARSGIIFNTKIGSPDWYWFAKDIKAPTLWQTLKAKNLSSAAIHWPVTAGAEIDFNFPEIWNEKNVNDRITVGKTYAPKGLLEEIEVNATGRLDSITMNAGFSMMGENVARMACYLFESKRPALLAVHFIDGDQQQIVNGR